MPPPVTEAAGGVLWRRSVGGAGVEVALVHRPKYGDWSLPKGKLLPDEHALVGAVREVAEETGFPATVGRFLGETRYLKDGLPKRVRYWSLRCGSGEFVPTLEVDQLMWLPPREGQRHLAPDRDLPILSEFLRDPVPTWPCLLVRHGSAGDRATWRGDDRERPLDPLGARQAEALVPVLHAYGVSRLLSADVLRCLDTMGPFAKATHLTIESEPLVSESGYPSNPAAAVGQMLAVLGTGISTAVSSQGKTIPDLLARICTQFDQPAPPDTSVRKGGWWVLHVAADGERLRLADVERFAPAG